MRAVVFDWDLTLWDSWGIHLRLMENTAADLGRPVPSAVDIAAEFHRPFRQHLVWFFGSRPDAESEADAILEAYLTHYYRMAGHRNYLYPGAASLLQSLRRRGIRIGIVSDKNERFGMPELEQSGLAGLVDYANFKTDARPYKPDPEGLRQTLDALQIAPDDALYVGDAPQDMVCARSAGVASAAAMWATIDYDAVLAQEPAYRLHRPHQVMAVVAEANGYGGGDAWVRHLPWPWRPDADNPHDDQDGGTQDPTPISSYGEPPPPSPQHWPMAARWRGRSGELRLSPEEANPVAPLSLRV
ncbi:MAG: HAD family hydrolase [Chloroflexi bacterium]|nr:HAD family hydrolase [Chloroflexota bacterium]MYD48416.1 HAD family hydrolase [Chloroflexota bacterium]MYE67996.1 HAD family hydrolase [Acidimicrobiia bacterium]